MSRCHVAATATTSLCALCVGEPWASAKCAWTTRRAWNICICDKQFVNKMFFLPTRKYLSLPTAPESWCGVSSASLYVFFVVLFINFPVPHFSKILLLPAILWILLHQKTINRLIKQYVGFAREEENCVLWAFFIPAQSYPASVPSAVLSAAVSLATSRTQAHTQLLSYILLLWLGLRVFFFASFASPFPPFSLFS